MQHGIVLTNLYENIQTGTGTLARVQGPQQRILVNDASSCNVDYTHTIFTLGKHVIIDHVWKNVSNIVLTMVHGDHVELGKLGPCYMWRLYKYEDTCVIWINSLAPQRFILKFWICSFNIILVIDSWFVSWKITLRWMPQNLTYEKSTLVQVMAWCRQATSHYLSQCWPRSISPYGVTKPQWAVLRKMQNPGSHNGPPMVDGWVVRLSSGWSVNQ